MLATPLRLTNQLPEPPMAASEPARLSIVLIEPTAVSLPDHRFLLSNDNYLVTAVRGTRELSLLSAAESFALALISDTLGRVGLVDAARSVRRQWPTARILVLGQAAVILEDNLYDDALPHSSGQQDLCDTLTRMSSQRTKSSLHCHDTRVRT